MKNLLSTLLLCVFTFSQSILGASLVEISDNKIKSTGIFSSLPGGVEPLFAYFSGERIYCATRHAGLFRSDNSGGTWKNISTDVMKIRTVLKERSGYRRITAFVEDSKNTNHLICAAQHALYESTDGGTTWKEKIIPSFSSMNYITALELTGSGSLFIGTAFNGLYEFTAGKLLSRNTGLFHQADTSKKTFIESISFIKRGRTVEELFLGSRFGKGLYVSSNGGKTFRQVSLPINEYDTVSDIAFSGNSATVAASSALFFLDQNLTVTETRKVQLSPKQRIVAYPDMKLCVDTSPYCTQNPKKIIKAIYSPPRAAEKNFSKLVAAIRKSGFNAIVIDYKDDSGYIYDSNSFITSREIGAVAKMDMTALVKKFKAEKIYTIARIVSFKDPKIHSAYKNRFAIKDARTGKPWYGNSKEKWVDPHSAFIRRYLVETAEHAQACGFDEVQFDYIRFPADGAILNCRYDFRETDSFKSEILTDFLAEAKAALTIPVSVDIYGFNGYYHFGNSIGQDVESFAEFADAISPMIYPSHYGPLFYKHINIKERPKSIVADSVKRACINSSFRTEIRPYLQGFNMRSPNFGPSYIQMQIESSDAAGGSGYIFWNAVGDYKALGR